MNRKNKVISSKYLYVIFKGKLLEGGFGLDKLSDYKTNYNVYSKSLDSGITNQDISVYLKTDLLPYFHSIFNFDKFNNYIIQDESEQDSQSLLERLSFEFVSFLSTEANELYFFVKDFTKHSEGIYELISGNNLIKQTLLFVFQNSVFKGHEKGYQLTAKSNVFLKQYLTKILIELRSNNDYNTQRLVKLEINRIQILRLKDTDFSLLNWYLEELKGVISDLKSISGAKPNYKLGCSNNAIRQLYNRLLKYDFIDVDYTSLKDFETVFFNDWYSHKSICVLKMDNPQTKFFINQFKIHIDKRLTLTDLEKAKNIRNKSGYIICSSINSSSSRNRLIGPKRQDDLAAVFGKNLS
ncbi:hypothetical protein SAMN04487911_1502 [Arenibacter nanhaiticus]|uniref:Uncharacterized protein n=1 Tax=Arenibacter nanhaiticus TaxID=558155 RepID=A0A1M6MXR0_9FLAO|nr:hypothetical protein [Arenibacter nanhaiticus]SHJ88180.1 hypothetical protein SAMN04487911_1502 [Arenibacter nanhaiticus]